MSYTAWFDIPLTCLACSIHVPGRETQLSNSQLLADTPGARVHAGEVINAEFDDLEDAYTRCGPLEGNEIHALEAWICPACGSIQWARIRYRREPDDHLFLIDAESILLDETGLAGIELITEDALEWTEPGSDRPPAALAALLERCRGS